MIPQKTCIKWQEYRTTAILPDGSIRQDWWNFIEDGTRIPLNFITKEISYCLLIAGKIQCLANLIEQAELTDKKEGFQLNVRNLITLDDQYTGGILGKELHKRKLESSKLNPKAFSWEVSVRFHLSPAERQENNLDRILNNTPNKAEKNLIEIRNRPEKEQITEDEKEEIHSVLTCKFTNDNVEKILRFGQQLFTSEQLESICNNPKFREKMFRKRWLTAGEFPPPLFRKGCQEKQSFLTHKGKIRWKNDELKHHQKYDIMWKDLTWICDSDIPIDELVDLLLPHKNNQMLNNLSWEKYPGEFPDLPRLVALANRHYMLELEKNETTTEYVTKQTLKNLIKCFGKENIQRLYSTQEINPMLQAEIGILIASQI